MTYLYIGLIVLVVVLGSITAYVMYRRNRGLSNLPRFWWQRRNDELSMVRAWVADNAERKVGTWFAELPAKEAKKIVADLREFAKEMDFEFKWVFEPGDLPDNKLQSELELAVMQRLEARFAAIQVQDNIEVYTQYQRVLDNPARHATLIQNLYTALVEREMAIATPPEMVMAPSSERRTFLLEQISKAANEDWSQFAEAMMNVTEKREENKRRWWQIKLPWGNKAQSNETVTSSSVSTPDTPMTPSPAAAT